MKNHATQCVELACQGTHSYDEAKTLLLEKAELQTRLRSVDRDLRKLESANIGLTGQVRSAIEREKLDETIHASVLGNAEAFSCVSR